LKNYIQINGLTTESLHQAYCSDLIHRTLPIVLRVVLRQ